MCCPAGSPRGLTAKGGKCSSLPRPSSLRPPNANSSGEGVKVVNREIQTGQQQT